MSGARTLNCHAALMGRMASVLGVDLTEAIATGRMSSEEWRGAVVSCTACADPRGCAEWLSHQNERADAKAPAYCCNQAFIHDIAARGTGAAKRIEEAL